MRSNTRLPRSKTCTQLRFPVSEVPPYTQRFVGRLAAVKAACSYRGKRPSQRGRVQRYASTVQNSNKLLEAPGDLEGKRRAG